MIPSSTVRPFIQRNLWWIGSALIMIPLIWISRDVLPVMVYYVTRLIYSTFDQ